MSEPTIKELLESIKQYGEKLYAENQRLRKQQKPTVTEKEIASAIYAGRNWDGGKFYDKDGIVAVIELFVSKGFKVSVA